MERTEFDVIIIGAGISGINAAYRVQESLPKFRYGILEARHEIGGTWSLFKYPGIRSDSDLFTFGFPWDPWTEDRTIATAPSILNYLKTVAERHGIDRHMKFGHRVVALDWRSELGVWQLQVQAGEHEMKRFQARFLIMGTGYYDYNEGLNSPISGIDNFKGTTVHPQFWPEHLDYTDKKVVIVGSGATAITILPTMSEKAAHVTMVQRSPGYMVVMPTVDKISLLFRWILPSMLAQKLIRMRFLLITFLFQCACYYLPNKTRQVIRYGISRQLPSNMPLDPHFNPTYYPGQQRTLLTPEGDVFKALRSGKASIITDQIETVTKTGLKLKSGHEINADILVTATGLKMQLLGNASLSIDGKPTRLNDKYVWRGAIVQDIPNLAFIIGYTNASWTLGSDATSRLFVRILKQMESSGHTQVRAHLSKDDQVKEVEPLDLTSSYVKAAMARNILPKFGDTTPWRRRDNYFYDSWFANYGDISTGLVYK